MNWRSTRLGFSMELVLLGRERFTWIVLSVFAVLCIYSTALGVSAWKSACAAGPDARRQTSRLLAKWRDEAVTGNLTSSGARGSRADSPYFVSAERLPYAIEPHPLAMMQGSAIQARTWADSLRVWSSAPDLFRHDDLNNPLLLQTGSLDTNLIAVYLLPLVLAALAMRGLVEDRVNEIHRLVQTLTGEGAPVMFGKLGAVFAAGMTPVLFSWVASLAFGSRALLLGSQWLLLVGVYALVWLAAISLLARRAVGVSGFLVWFLSLWMYCAILAPVLRFTILGHLAPASDPAAAVLERQAIDTRMKDLRESAADLVRRKHPDWFGASTGNAREISILTSFLAAEDELLRGSEAERLATERRAAWSSRLAWLSPCLLAGDRLAAASGVDDEYYEHGRGAIERQIGSLRELLFPMILQGGKMDAASYESLARVRGISPAGER